MNREASEVDRLCDECHKPMVGIMKASGEKTPRKICAKCGGDIILPEKEDDDGD